MQVNWGLFSGKYLTAAVGSARSYVQVRSALLRVDCICQSCHYNHASTAMHALNICVKLFQPLPLLLLTPSGVFLASAGHMHSF